MNEEMINQEETPLAEESAAEEVTPAAESNDEQKTESKKDKKADIKKLKAELEEAQKKCEAETKRADEANEKYLRVAAEYENFRKRSQKEREGIYSDAVADTLSGLLPIIDNLQYASKYSSGDAEKVAEGLVMILGKLPETLEKLGIQQFGEAGEAFDPNIHNAVLHVDDESYGEGEIVDVLQCGYKYGDKVLRYAMVKVAN